MKKKKKYVRETGYALAGLAIGVTSFFLLQANMPVSAEHKTTLLEYNLDEEFSEYTLSYEDYNGVVIPFNKFGTYHVTPNQMQLYIDKEIVNYGKQNPLFRYSKTVVPAAETLSELGNALEDLNDALTEAFSSDESEPSENITGEVESNEVESKKSGVGGNDFNEESFKETEGFNIKLEKLEVKDTSLIAKDFSENGVLPVGKKYFNKSSGFGKRPDPFENKVGYHVGLDLSAPGIDGSEVYSVLDGEVLEVRAGEKGLGNYIVIGHSGYETLYAHLIEKPKLSVGDIVQAGDVIGHVGSTGRSTGPHLHFEVGQGALKFDPEQFIRLIENGEG